MKNLETGNLYKTLDSIFETRGSLIQKYEILFFLKEEFKHCYIFLYKKQKIEFDFSCVQEFNIKNYFKEIL